MQLKDSYIQGKIPNSAKAIFTFSITFYRKLHYITLGTWYSTVTRVHMEVLSHVLYMFLLLGPLSILYHTVSWGGATPSKINSLGNIQVHISCKAVPLLSFNPSTQHILLLHSLVVDRSMVVGHVPMDHTCSFMCTSHIDMTAHNPVFLRVG